jgi:hypothetical protein
MPLTSLLPVTVHVWGNTRSQEEYGSDVLLSVQRTRMPALPEGR